MPLSDIAFFTGILGATVLVAGSAWPEKGLKKEPKHPAQSVKNWLFAVGALLMGCYGALGWMQGGTAFFMFLEALVLIASVFLLANVSRRISVPIILVCAAGFIIWSFILSQGLNTLIFILGITGIALGYIVKPQTFCRHEALVAGSLLIAFFSYRESDWIFFWLNIFFALFSVYYAAGCLRIKRAR